MLGKKWFWYYFEKSKILKVKSFFFSSHPTRPLDLHIKWSELIREEFFSQGDLERNRGVRISPLCDRNVSQSSYPQGQIGYYNSNSHFIYI